LRHSTLGLAGGHLQGYRDILNLIPKLNLSLKLLDIRVSEVPRCTYMRSGTPMG
jgi:hypothetical protein